MNIMLVAQCSKQALPSTRRILDQFAERKGSRTWLTPITEQGLKTLHQLLRQRARRNTAVACHRIRGNRIELLWIVGNRRKFNREGNVPTDTRQYSALNDIREDGWRHTQSIALLAALAGLFHDFGKANDLFQEKLNNAKAPRSEPLRHEWLSVRLFEAFVDTQSDSEWLAAMTTLDAAHSDVWIERALKDGLRKKSISPLHRLRDKPVARAVCWLILTHHRLPYSTVDGEGQGNEVEKWTKLLRPHWNSPQFSNEADDATMTSLWTFRSGLPVISATWRARAKQVSERALKHPDLLLTQWFDNTFVLHLARCALMLADHSYSAGGSSPKWQDKNYSAYANTHFVCADNSTTRVLHQQLDEHCIGVTHFAWLFARSLPRVRSLLPAIGDVRSLRKPSKGDFSWQNKAFALARRSAEASQSQGGFFINMASTGTGKTLANARMAYALSDEKIGCRFSILLGLRTLTLQTGDALRTRTGLGESELGVLVGSSAVRELHEKNKEDTNQHGSASADPLVDANDHIYYEGELTQSRFGKWLGQQRSATLLKLLSAPVLVCTIDYLMPATEGARGGRQIGPMLRLLSGDIVLDEPDEFGLSDQMALCRLVYWSGLLGGRVILSSATLSPALVEALFLAYSEGRNEYNQATAGKALPVVCGWIDEHDAADAQIHDPCQFPAQHKKFVEKRQRKLAQLTPRRKAALIDIVSDVDSHSAVAKTISEQIVTLHHQHHSVQTDADKCVSVGLVRMANINPLVAVAKELVRITPPPDVEINLCVYHSRHPLLRRHEIERELDTLLDRTDSSQIWRHPAVVRALQRRARHQVFVVLATAVAEVGRDHCYDWAIVEPSSMRSIVQLSGRVMRHRQCETPAHANILLLQQNLKALENSEICFERPGYESKQFKLQSHILEDCLPAEHYQYPAAKSCIEESSVPQIDNNLVDLEHAAMRAALLDRDNAQWPASSWWRQPVRWCYQMQQATRFRAGPPSDFYALVTDDETELPTFQLYHEGEWIPVEGQFIREDIDCVAGVQWWPVLNDETLLASFSEDTDLVISCRRWLTFELERSQEMPERWCYHQALGIFRLR